MFRVATEVGVATRPLLFYELSQAGRAIATAASAAAADRVNWKVTAFGAFPRPTRGRCPY